MHNFKELKVWKAGIEVSKLTFNITRNFPSEERYGLISQMTRSAVSIPSNIAEGCGRKSNKELYHFLNISLGSAFELETQCIIAKEFGYMPEIQLNEITALLSEIQRMIYGLQKSLNI
ncbi:four helix bundle protein [Mucilaginibacter sp. PAMC 26640]|nr:four helix bundle protein [Mucilaginibacter sp. PAMC 26640]